MWTIKGDIKAKQNLKQKHIKNEIQSKEGQISYNITKPTDSNIYSIEHPSYNWHILETSKYNSIF